MNHSTQYTLNNIRNFDDLHSMLSSETIKLIAKKIGVSEAKTVSLLALRMISIVRVQLEYVKVTGKNPKDDFVDLFNNSKGETPGVTVKTPTNGKRKTPDRLGIKTGKNNGGTAHRN